MAPPHARRGNSYHLHRPQSLPPQPGKQTKKNSKQQWRHTRGVRYVGAGQGRRQRPQHHAIGMRHQQARPLVHTARQGQTLATAVGPGQAGEGKRRWGRGARGCRGQSGPSPSAHPRAPHAPPLQPAPQPHRVARLPEGQGAPAGGDDGCRGRWVALAVGARKGEARRLRRAALAVKQRLQVLQQQLQQRPCLVQQQWGLIRLHGSANSRATARAGLLRRERERAATGAAGGAGGQPAAALLGFRRAPAISPGATALCKPPEQPLCSHGQDAIAFRPVRFSRLLVRCWVCKHCIIAGAPAEVAGGCWGTGPASLSLGMAGGRLLVAIVRREQIPTPRQYKGGALRPTEKGPPCRSPAPLAAAEAPFTAL